MHNDTKKQFDKARLILGQVDFINCLPINLPVELGKVKVNAKVVKDIPSKLNEMILSKDIDVAPVSSLTYIENKNILEPIANLCIASNGPADSVLLFSKYPLEELNGSKIALSHASATSNKLLQILLKDFLKTKATFVPSSQVTGHRSDYSAWLLIGDYALLEYSKSPTGIFVYDLGSLWKKHTGLPMVFGVWVIRKEAERQRSRDAEIIRGKLREAKEIGSGPMFDTVIKEAQSRILNSRDFYKLYFEHLSYEFTSEYRKGLEVFEEYCKVSPAMTPATA